MVIKGINKGRGLLILVILGTWIGPLQAGELIQRQGEPDAYQTEPEDISLGAAQIEAQLNLNELFERIQFPPAQQTDLAVKGIFGEADRVEHLWVRDLRVEDNRVVGTLDNQPVELSQWSAGDLVILDRDQISDWMAIDSGHLIGGWTLRALRQQMTEAERSAFDDSLDFSIEDPVTDGAEE